MFTGLVQGKGKVKALGNDLFAIEIDKNAQNIICQDLAIGDSVAVDGICLTVEKIIKGGFVATASTETLERTILGKNINAMKLSKRVAQGGYLLGAWRSAFAYTLPHAQA